MSNESISFWLSQLQIKSPEKNKRLFRYQLHQFIWQAFPGCQKNTKQPFLFTLLEQKEPDSVFCLVQSISQPNWSAISEKDEQNVRLVKSPEMKYVNVDISIGDIFALHIHLCPIKNITIHDKILDRGLKAPIFNHSEMEKYLNKKAEQNGFLAIHEEFSIEKTFIRRQKTVNVKDIKISECRYNSLVEITDVKKFTSAILHGIGSKKIFGFGMLLLTSRSS